MAAQAVVPSGGTRLPLGALPRAARVVRAGESLGRGARNAPWRTMHVVAAIRELRRRGRPRRRLTAGTREPESGIRSPALGCRASDQRPKFQRSPLLMRNPKTLAFGSSLSIWDITDTP